MRTLHRILLATLISSLAGCGWITLIRPGQASTQQGQTSPVDVPIEIEVTKSVYDRVFEIEGGPAGNPTTSLTNFSTAPKPGEANVEILTTTAHLQVGAYTLTGKGVYNTWTNSTQSISETSQFSVSLGTPVPSVTIAITPASDIRVPRRGSATATVTADRINSSDPVTVTVSGLTTGLSAPTLTIPSGTGTGTGSISVSATEFAKGSSTATFSARMGAIGASAQHSIKVIPQPGLFTWLSSPYLGANGRPDESPSPDGRFSVSATRVNFSRNWTLKITPTSGNGSPLDVTAASWSGAQGSNLMGIVFCPFSKTTSALVLSDANEGDVGTHGNSVTYQAKILALDGPTPREVGGLQGIRYFNGAVPNLGFSQDCSIVGAWSNNTEALPSERSVTFTSVYTSGSIGTWTFSDPAIVPTPPFSASIAGSVLSITAPQSPGISFSIP